MIILLIGKKNFFKILSFILIFGGIRKLDDCLRATKNIDFVLRQAALGSVPRSIKDPLTSNKVNVSGFLNVLFASRDNGVKVHYEKIHHYKLADAITVLFSRKAKINNEIIFSNDILLIEKNEISDLTA